MFVSPRDGCACLWLSSSFLACVFPWALPKGISQFNKINVLSNLPLLFLWLRQAAFTWLIFALSCFLILWTEPAFLEVCVPVALEAT